MTTTDETKVDDPFVTLRKLLKRAKRTAYGDSNDAEIDALRDALDEALSLLGCNDYEPTDDEIDKWSDL